MKCLGLIPARAGSKGVPNKNLRSLCGRPLLEYTCEAARSSRRLTRTILSTDSVRMAEAGRDAGVEAPFLRPAEFAADDTPMKLVVRHALDWLEANETYSPDIVVLLQPTSPLRTGAQIDEAVDLLIASRADSVVSVTTVPAHYHPAWQFRVDDGELRLLSGEPIDRIITSRQMLPTTYTRNGAIYAFWRRTLTELGSFYGSRTMAYVMAHEDSVNIDSLEDWMLAEAYLDARKTEAAGRNA